MDVICFDGGFVKYSFLKESLIKYKLDFKKLKSNNNLLENKLNNLLLNHKSIINNSLKKYETNIETLNSQNNLLKQELNDLKIVNYIMYY